MSTLTEIETRVRRFVLDVGEAAYTDAEITAALGAAQREVWQLASDSTPMQFAVAVNKTSSSAGVIDLSAEDPRRILNVAELHGDVRYPIAGGTLLDVRTHLRSALQVEVIYLGRCAYPSAAGNPFLWGTSEAEDELNELLVLTAVSALLVKTDTVNAALEARAKALREAIRRQANGTSFRAFSTTPQPRSSYRWHKLSGDTLQLFSV